MKRIPFGTLAAGVLLVGGATVLMFTPHIAHAATTGAAPSQATITVIGHGDEKVSPDTATIDAGIVTKAADARQAQQKNDAAMTKLLNRLKTYGVTANDVHTQWYSIHPDYTSDPKSGQQSITGFEADDNIQVDVHNLNKVGTLVDALVQLGANQINGVNYQVSNPQAIQQHLIDTALADAKSQAQHIAKSLGIMITGVQSVDTTVGNSGPIIYAAGETQAMAAAPISPGTQDVSTSVKVVYTISSGQ